MSVRHDAFEVSRSRSANSARLRARRFLVALLGFVMVASVTVVAGSQESASAQTDLDTTMLLFDLSGSMGTREPDGRTRLAVAQQAMIEAIGGIEPGSRNMGIRSFSDCGVTRLEQPPMPVDPVSLAATINSLFPDALTDIAGALTAVAGDFGSSSGRNTVILLSDGAHNCAGDPCQTAADLIAAGVDIVVHAIGIGTAGTSAETQLSCIANVTGGTVVSVDGADELFDAIDQAFEDDGATSALVEFRIPTCINSAMVQNDPSLLSAALGDAYRDSGGTARVLVSGEQCNFDCADGFDINCDGVLGDFCNSDFDRTTVHGVGQCLEELGEGDDGGDSGIPDPLLEKYCPDTTGDPGFALDPQFAEACGHYESAKTFQRRADAARGDGDASHAAYNQTLADSELAKARAALLAILCAADGLADAAIQRASAFNWQMDYRISGDDGLVLTDVFLGNRKMAERISIPYLSVEIGFSDVRIELTDNPAGGDCPDATSRSRLVSSNASTFGSTLRVEATYQVDQIEGLDGILTVTQRYEFDAELADGRCEPSQESPTPFIDRRVLPCNPFRLTVDYDYDGTDQFTSIEIPQRFHFAVEGASNNAVTVFRDFDDIGSPEQILSGLSPIRSSTTLESERTFRALTNGRQALIDNYHQTYTARVRPPEGFPVAKPGCPECVHIHWRWSAVIGNPQYGAGAPLIPPGSTQSLEIGVSRFRGSELDPANYRDVIDGEPVGLGGGDPVMWYVSKSRASSDAFFTHQGRGGAFFSTGYVDLSVDVETADEIVGPGEPTEATVVLRNSGPGDATNVEVYIEAVGGVILEDSVPDFCQHSTGSFVLTCTFDRYVANAFRTIRFEAAHADSSAGGVDITVSVKSDHIEFREGNDSDQASFRAVALVADLELTGSVREVGGDVRYQLVVENIQSGDARDVVLTVQLPDGVDPARADVQPAVAGDCSVNNAQATVTCEWDSLFGPGGTEVVNITVPTGGQSGAALVATVSSAIPDRDESNNRLELTAPG